ncbi:hypothetical protein DRN73_08355 [Candidatus Pacearchaeota archaeon]|nr:MAG: hypothetical protein DRN73_08355 [Candidatus Pacearchaeota archaeon]
MVNLKKIGGVAIILIGLYLLNMAFPLITLPSFFVNYENWFLAIGAIIVIISSFRYFKSEAY